jgi:hypothetical protein
MPRILIILPVLLTLFPTGTIAQGPVPLPVRQVVLYKNGVGYFEHRGAIKGSQTVEIVLPSAQLNDVLKSLTILDLGQGRIAGVEYDSTSPLERRLAEMPISLGSAEGLVGFLNQVRGTGVEVRAPGGVITGRLMGAEIKTKVTGQNTTTESIQISVYTPAAEVKIIDLESAGAFRLTDPPLAEDLSRYLEILDTSHQRDVRRMRIRTVGSGERQLYISYTAESPIWKATYRIVLDPKQKPILQGWAIVDNTTPMDWSDVTLSLVSGAPISFVQNLSQPLYARRPVIPLPEGLQVSPQVHEATLSESEQPSAPATGEMKAVTPARPAPAEARMLRRDAVMAEAAKAEPEDLSSAIRRQVPETAQAQVVGEQFEYRLPQPVTIPRNESALLPIIQKEVDGDKVALFGSQSTGGHPRLAIWLRNSSGLTLDGGSFSIIDSNAFAGEGLFETIQPGESRLLSYAVDLGMEVSTTIGSEKRRVERVQIERGILRMHSTMLEKRTYRIRNNNENARVLVIEHPLRPGWKLVETATPVESTASHYRFRTEIKPKSSSEFVVNEESPLETTYAVSNVTPDQIAVWVRDRSIDPETEKVLRNIAAKKSDLNEVTQKQADLEKEQAEIFRDQERVRSNLQRLGQSPGEAALRQRYIREMEEQEDRLASLRTERAKLESSRAEVQRQLDELIQNLSWDRKI